MISLFFGGILSLDGFCKILEIKGYFLLEILIVEGKIVCMDEDNEVWEF